MKLRTILSLSVFLAATANAALAADAIEIVKPDGVPADAISVDIAKMKFAPGNLEIEQGAVIKWTNRDAVPHNVFVQEPFEVVGDMLRAGQSVALKFTTPGEYSYICTPHPFMKGKITVKPKS
ncbi:plastocyanin/azurin family copper-binding protein [Hyphomicrobium sp.]|uniref:plastocyanin/azurin family copper-binding protein n=1 Tax=Hyphomicrobium sp. TaxID=82 RepID=UPI002E338815|nr:plastocyanin/azurin family copper-binding protein [Hyphomicrobium sp.]HEX2841578.1 plastocyanin/azurin family copper-binding protein [Hyphomicrobium sp.]